MKSTSQLLRNYRETCNIPFSLSTYLKKYYEKEVGEKLLLIITSTISTKEIVASNTHPPLALNIIRPLFCKQP